MEWEDWGRDKEKINEETENEKKTDINNPASIFLLLLRIKSTRLSLKTMIPQTLSHINSTK